MLGEGAHVAGTGTRALEPLARTCYLQRMGLMDADCLDALRWAR